MTGPASRRGFLSGLATLPLIGGSVSLIGSPIGAAEKPSVLCLETYCAWLHYEQRALQGFLYPGIERGTYIPLTNQGARFHFADRFGHDGWWQRVEAETAARAPVVLATVGCDWRKGDV